MRPTASPLRIGMAGWGHAARLQSNALEADRGFEVVAVYEPASSAALEACNLLSCPTVKALIDDARCDIVSVCAPPAAHAGIVAQALAGGASVLVEKPVTSEPVSYTMLKALAAQSRGIAYSALHAAFGREVAWAARQLEGVPDPGPLVRFSCEFTDPYVASDGQVRPDAVALGGPWLDSAINALSVIARITSLQPWTISAALASRSRSELAARARFVGPEGAVGRITTRWTRRPARKTTSATFASGLRLELDHVAQSGRLEAGSFICVLPAHTATRERLLEHYLGVFEDFRAHLLAGRSNLEAAETAHRLVYRGVRLMSG